MTFGEKLRAARREQGLTQAQLAESAGIALKTVINYESGKTHPHSRETYRRLAAILGTDEYYLYNENESLSAENAAFIAKAGEEYGSRGRKQAEELVADFGGLFSGGTLSESEKDGVMRALQELYWKYKEENRAKYSSSKPTEGEK